MDQTNSTNRESPGLHSTTRKNPETRRAHLPVSLCETDVRETPEA